MSMWSTRVSTAQIRTNCGPSCPLIPEGDLRNTPVGGMSRLKRRSRQLGVIPTFAKRTTIEPKSPKSARGVPSNGLALTCNWWEKRT